MKSTIYKVLFFGFLAIHSYCSYSQERSWKIIVDQFGYLPDAPKVAVIKDPQVGFDAWQEFTPGSVYSVINADNGQTVFTGTPFAWNGGATDASSGDRVWWFDFTAVTATGNYYVLDVERNLRSFEFRISPSVYNEVLRQAVRTFFYQRAGFTKALPYAERGWTDAASHIGPGQSRNARLFNDANNPLTERDLSGAWYDAGDFNKYTNWTADYVVEMMLAYLERPEVWTDDFNIPESGNGIPDLLDEAKWGIDHLLRMQNQDGGVLSIVGVAHASPPSAATGPSLYGPASTSATLTTAAAFAIASKAYRSIGRSGYADTLKNRAIRAWQWADVNPNVTFRNNDTGYRSVGLGAGQQEVDDYGRLTKKLRAAAYLFEITGDTIYRNFFDSNYTRVNMLQWNFVFPFQTVNQDMLLYYTTIQGATPSVVSHIRQVYGQGMITNSANFPAFNNRTDPYRAHLADYTWGSNAVKCHKGGMFYNMITFNINPALNVSAREAAIGYINYIHGVNPLNFVYLSNMYKHGAEYGVNEFFHSWFANGSARWDRAGVSTYGPAPGFLTGGPNPSYNWDACCPSNCGSTANNALCLSESIIPPREQPVQKSYKDFNTSWPLNSWSISENSNGYQMAYIRLLSKFVNPQYDCNGDLGGSAIIDVCGRCTGGRTGVTPETNPANCVIPNLNTNEIVFSPFRIYPNPFVDYIRIVCQLGKPYQAIIQDVKGNVISSQVISGNVNLCLKHLQSGNYLITFINESGVYGKKIIKL